MANFAKFPSLKSSGVVFSDGFKYCRLQQGETFSFNVNATCVAYGAGRRQGTFELPSLLEDVPIFQEQTQTSGSNLSPQMVTPYYSGLSVYYPKSTEINATLNILNSFDYTKNAVVRGGDVSPSSLYEETPGVGCIIPCVVSFEVASIEEDSFRPVSYSFNYGVTIQGSSGPIGDSVVCRLNNSGGSGGLSKEMQLQRPKITSLTPERFYCFWNQNTKTWTWSVTPVRYTIANTTAIETNRVVFSPAWGFGL